ncbi:SET and MYND domain-containing protein 4 [Anopheles nili]|uniref:SET and MYND domain-containing protein 4 n=1 Tax=Anopheles nili TaxID=185578 RepID=UPI00237B8958|nr:SET and MYND domain-containing protein 4 [Anopheles nili]
MSNQLEEKFGAWELFEELWEESMKDDAIVAVSQAIRYKLLNEPCKDRLNLRQDVKDNAKARDLRTKGNELFHPKVKRYIEATKYYNESISFSTKGSEERGMAYSNRSMICYALRQYDDCLKNIALARESNYPERLAVKLAQREADAKRALQVENNNNQDSTDGQSDTNCITEPKELKLSYDSLETLPQVANCLELRESKDFGRFVATNKSLKVGDVVIIEKPFCNLLLDTYRCIRCDFCHRESMFTLIPCENCTVAMYCSEECMEKAHAQYHRYECPIIRDLWRIFTKIPVLAVRTVISAIAAFGHNLSAMKDYLEELNESQVNAFTMDWRTATPQDIYSTVHVLESNHAVRDGKDREHRRFFAYIALSMLMDRTELGPVCDENPEIQEMLFDLLERHMQTCPVNMHSLYYMDYHPKRKEYDMEKYASGCFPLLSMLNHSCAPNMTRLTLPDGRCAVIISRPIPEGGQLYDNYGMHHCLMARTERRSDLMKQYKFPCKCEACENNYPMLFNLPRVDFYEHGMIDVHSIHAELVMHQPKKAEELLPKLLGYLNKITQYPYFEVCCCQELLLRCLEILHMYTSKSTRYLRYCKP